MNPQFETLLNIIDHIREQAPASLRSIYLPPPRREERVKQARARAYIHLYLMVKHGLLDFVEREKFICDGRQDGGLDAYYIDHETKTRTLIQSKFHMTERNFEVDQMSIDELSKMEIDRILRGEKKTSYGKTYNPSVRRLQRELKTTRGIFKNNLVLLANVPHTDYKIKKAIGYDQFEVFGFDRSYSELVFPYCSGIFHVPKEIQMMIRTRDKAQVALQQYIKTTFGEAEVMIIFVPAREVGRVLSAYKNGILQFNPRNYLSLGEKVNRDIRYSITNLGTNDFAILNNGITILADYFLYDPHTGDKRHGRLVIRRPQIINGGQTAYTLSEIYEHEFRQNSKVFGDKEVMLKLVRILKRQAREPEFVEMVSNATNKQTRVKEADRRSNHPTLIEIQQRIYQGFGYFFERKSGEFYDGIFGAQVLNRNYLIHRDTFVRAFAAFRGEPSIARSKGESALFNEKRLTSVFPDSSVYVRAFFAYKILRHLFELERIERRKDYGKRKYGFALRYGKYAVIAAVGASNHLSFSGKENLEELAKVRAKAVLSRWRAFEKQAKLKASKTNPFPGDSEGFDNYYKSTTMDSDVKAFFGKR